MVNKFFDKKSSSGSGVTTLANKFAFANNKIKQNMELAEELHKPNIRNFRKEQFIQDIKTISGVLI